MGFSEAVQWWEEWQLRLLVLASLFLQYFLFVAALVRKRRIPLWFRSLIWLAYQGCDIVAIYALATLFNRHKKDEWASTHPNSGELDVLWAPILLLHLGGQDGITAYCIEDNELWRRHFLTAVSQITVAVYVFRKSWWSEDMRLLRAAILLFVPGIVKCLEKPWALKNATITSIASSSSSQLEKTLHDDDDMVYRAMNVSSLDEFVQAAAKYVNESSQQQPKPYGHTVKDEPYHLFVDLGVPYPVRLLNLRYMARPTSQSAASAKAHGRVRAALSRAFDRLYTKHRASFGGLLRAAVVLLTFADIGLFQRSRHRAASYAAADVWVTYVVLCCTAALELVSACFVLGSGLPPPDDRAAQYNLIAYTARNGERRRLRSFARMVGYKDALDRLWPTAPAEPSAGITERVHDHVAAGWKLVASESGVDTYRWFNQCRGQCTLRRDVSNDGKREAMERSLRRPFDESVLLWHLATDFCYYHHVDAGGDATRRSRVISNYMAYLLFVKPEMLIPGARRRLFTAAYHELKAILSRSPVPPKDAAELTEKKAPPPPPPPAGSKEELARKIIQKVKTLKSPNGRGPKGSGLVEEAWALAQELMSFGEEEKMWKVIEGVWVEMLCFSAGRCRGYLHARSLGTGGEYLSYVWLLLSYMGMETFAEKMQWTELPVEGDAGGVPAPGLVTADDDDSGDEKV
ncbi:hypothetical protein ACP70R_008296 [Stipagrostis hirtigluma subsp. patula]